MKWCPPHGYTVVRATSHRAREALERLYVTVPVRRTKPGHVILDAGAYDGADFTLPAALRAAHGKVYAVEPCRDSCDLLRVNVTRAGLHNVDVSQLALADTDGSCTLFHSSDARSHSIVARRNAPSNDERVRACTLARFLTDKHIKHCNLAVFHIEGAEFPVLLATPARTLAVFDELVIQRHSELWPHDDSERLPQHLRRAGFTVWTPFASVPGLSSDTIIASRLVKRRRSPVAASPRGAPAPRSSRGAGRKPSASRRVCPAVP